MTTARGRSARDDGRAGSPQQHTVHEFMFSVVSFQISFLLYCKLQNCIILPKKTYVLFDFVLGLYLIGFMAQLYYILPSLFSSIYG